MTKLLQCLSEIQARVDQTTGKKWEVNHEGDVVYRQPTGDFLILPVTWKDSEFIAKSRLDIEKLLKIVRAQDAFIDTCYAGKALRREIESILEEGGK